MKRLSDVVEIHSLTPENARALAVMHISSIPDSSLSKLGVEATAAFYRFVAKSSQETLFISYNVGKTPVATCVLSFSPATIKQRMVLNIRMLISMLSAFISRAFSRSKKSGNSHFKAELLEGNDISTGLEGQHFPAADPLGEAPEVLYIFADPSCRGAGIGRRLMRSAEQVVARKKYDRLIVHTQSNPKNPALEFYLSIGYMPCSISQENGKNLMRFEKKLPALKLV